MYLSALCKSRFRDYSPPFIHWGVTKTQLRSNKTTFLAMKLTAILVLTAVLQVSAKTYSQTITLNVQNAPLDKVVKEIEKQSKFNFFYQEGLFQNAKPVTVSVSKSTLTQALELCFSGQPFEYKIVQNTVFVKRKEAINIENTEAVKINNGDFKGRVLTKEGEPLASANVVNKRTGKGTTTDANGNFLLHDVTLNDILIVTYTGYAPRHLKVSEFISMTLVMEAAINELDQVVMQAYGTTTRRFATGNIAKVTAEEISKQPVINPLQALQGRVPGLIVTQTNGFSSAPFKIEIRGRNTVNSDFTSDPLYIIDGVPLTIQELLPGNSSYNVGSKGFLQNGLNGPAGGQSPLFSINPNDIESIEVLKDADATSIYGSRAANGVILITTKKAKASKTKLNMRFTQGVSKITRYWDMLNTEQYLDMRREALKNDNRPINTGTAYDLLIWDTLQYTNWQKELWGGTGKNSDIQIGLSGGNNNTAFRLGAGYTRTTNILTISGADQRASVSMNLTHSAINHKFNISISSTYSYGETNMVNLPGSAITLPPNAPAIFDEEGKLNYSGWAPRQNTFPFAGLLQPYTSNVNFLNSNVTLNYQILKQVSFRTSFGYNSSQTNQVLLQPIISQDPNNNPTGTAQFGANSNKNWIIEPQIDYNEVIGKGKLNILVGASTQKNTTQGQLVIGEGYTNDALIKTISNAPNVIAKDNFGEYRYSAVFGRLNYNLKNKYILNLSVRRDGSSNFGSGNQFGNFGSMGAAWLFSEESFFDKAVKFISYGKLRTSYGTTGGEGPPYGYMTRWASQSVTYNSNTALEPIQHANPAYKWQENKKFESALELGFWDDKVTLSVSYYRNRCNNQLVSFPLGTFTGFPYVIANSPANVLNTGWEFFSILKPINRKYFQWTINFNTAINKNKLLSYPNIELSPYASTLIVGESLNITKLLKYTGVDPTTGKHTFEDKDKDGMINTDFASNTNDLFAYNLSPKFSGGLGSNMTYKNISLSLFFSIVKKLGRNALSGLVPGGIRNMPVSVLSRWQKPGDISENARFTTLSSDITNFNYAFYSDGIYTDASFIRLQNVSLSYRIPEKLIKKTGLNSFNIFINTQNLFVLTSYKGLDPETQNFGGMPPSKVITGGININF